MKTFIIQIGNSDNKLSQNMWSEFIKRLHSYLLKYPIHFSGGSSPEKEWQNYCFVFEAVEKEAIDLSLVLRQFCKDYNQCSIALTVGETSFVSPE